MTNFSNKIYVLLSILTRQPKSCPFCGSRSTVFAGKNAYLSHVRRCTNCHLIFRWPKQSESFNKNFYRLNYISLASPDVQLPSPQEAQALLQSNFKNHYKSLGTKLEIVQLFKTSGRLLVYGANWGYEVVQFSRAGYEAIGYEVSSPRAEFGEKYLGSKMFHDLKNIRKNGPYDIVFSSHTLEHLPSPAIALSLFETVCAEKSVLVILVPNCGGRNAQQHGVQWGPFSSSLHPLSYTASFFRSALPKYGFEVISTTSEPYNPQSIPDTCSQEEPPGDELLVIAVKKNT